jgi:hypothetical protein
LEEAGRIADLVALIAAENGVSAQTAYRWLPSGHDDETEAEPLPIPSRASHYS